MLGPFSPAYCLVSGSPACTSLAAQRSLLTRFLKIHPVCLVPTWPELLWFLVTIFSDSLHDLNASCTCIHGPVRPHNFQNVFTRGTRVIIHRRKSLDGRLLRCEKSVGKVNLITRPLGSRCGRRSERFLNTREL